MSLSLDGSIWPPVLLGAVAILLAISRVLHRDTRGLPPGPKPSLFFGTSIPKPYAWRHFEAWSKIYGDVFTVWLGRTPLIVVNSYQGAQEIMEKHAAQTASRPRSYVAAEVLSRGLRMVLSPYGDRWRRMRRAVHTKLQPAMAKTYEPMQEYYATGLIADILREPDDFQKHTQVYASSLILNITYGRTGRLKHTDADLIEIHRNQQRLGAVMGPGKYLADQLPWLGHIPGYLKLPRSYGVEEMKVFKKHYERVRDNLEAGRPQKPCFVTLIIERQSEFQLSNDEAYYLCGNLFGAGSETSSAALQAAIMAAAVFPEAQKKAQEELDTVVGRLRLPVFADWPFLPYVSAFAKEVLRWRPVSSGGFQHAVNETFEWKGYIFPKGAAIVGNHWAIHRDERVFPEPDVFRPERFLRSDDKGGTRLCSESDLRHFTYGFGRRACGGSHVADRSVFINCALLLHCFDIGHKVDQFGETLPIDTYAWSDHTNSHPLPGMPVSFRPRFDGVAELVRATGVE